MINRNATSIARVVVHTTEPGGLAPYVSSLVIGLAQCGVPIVLFCPGNFDYESEVRKAGVEVIHAAERDITIAGFFRRVLRNLKFVAKSALIQLRVIRSGDVVHFQSVYHLPIGLVFLLVARLRGASIVLTAHDPLPHRWRLPRSLRWIDRAMLRTSYRWCDCIIVHNQAGKDALDREFKSAIKRIAVIPHGPYSAESEQMFPPLDGLRLLAFGAVRANKGLHLAIEAVQQANRISELPIFLTIAGRVQNASEQQYWQGCKELIRREPQFFNVIEGLIPEEDIPALMGQHHAVLLPYTQFYSESGVGALAASHQRAIIATATGGLGELLERGSCGIRIDSTTADSVVEAIVTATRLGSDALREMGQNGKEFIFRERSWDAIARQTAMVYASIANMPLSFREGETASKKHRASAPESSCS